MRHLPRTKFRSMPWKNGGGETFEIYSYPEASDLTQFEWRISMARVTQAGPFSHFPFTDRLLAVLEGEGLVLTVGDDPPHVLTPQSPALAFAGDVSTTATLCDGPITDLNVMVRRGVWKARLTAHWIESLSTVTDLSDQTVLVLHQGQLTYQTEQGACQLLEGDALLLGHAPDAPRVIPAERSLIWRVDLQRV